MAQAHHARDAGPKGGRHPGTGILDGTGLSGVQLQQLQGQSIGLGIRFFADHIPPANPDIKGPEQVGKKLFRQGIHRLPATGGHDRLAQTRPRRGFDQGAHPRAERQLPLSHQVGVMALLAGMELCHPLGIGGLSLVPGEIGANALSTSGNG